MRQKLANMLVGGPIPDLQLRLKGQANKQILGQGAEAPGLCSIGHMPLDQARYLQNMFDCSLSSEGEGGGDWHIEATMYPPNRKLNVAEVRNCLHR